MLARRIAPLLCLLAAPIVAVSCVPDPPASGVVVAYPLRCDGVLGDAASSIGSSYSTVQLLRNLSGSAGFFEFPDATVTARVPETSRKGTPYAISFDLSWGTLPAGSPSLAVFGTLMSKPTVAVTQTLLAVSATGSPDTTIGAPGAVTVADTSGALSLPAMTVSGTVDQSADGPIRYGVSAVRLAIAVDATVSGVSVGTINLECSPGTLLPVVTTLEEG